MMSFLKVAKRQPLQTEERLKNKKKNSNSPRIKGLNGRKTLKEIQKCDFGFLIASKFINTSSI
jgi:hypothetical protein